jgi:archaellum component FlaD/FlaE
VIAITNKPDARIFTDADQSEMISFMQQAREDGCTITTFGAITKAKTHVKKHLGAFARPPMETVVTSESSDCQSDNESQRSGNGEEDKDTSSDEKSDDEDEEEETGEDDDEENEEDDGEDDTSDEEDDTDEEEEDTSDEEEDTSDDEQYGSEGYMVLWQRTPKVGAKLVDLGCNL